MTHEEETKPLEISEVTPIETTEKMEIEETKPEKATPKLDIQKPLKTEATATCKKIDDTAETIEEPTKAQALLSPTEPMVSEQIQPGETLKDIKETKPKTRKARVDIQQEIAEFANITEVKLEEVIQRVEKIIKKSELKMAREVTEMLDYINVKEFGPGEQPLREIAEIGYLLKNGINTKEVTVLYHENKFPSLTSPQAQSALVNVVERKGHGAIISEVLTEETTIDEKQLAATVGFRALMKMVESNYVTIEEVITSFTPEDFIQRAWETSEITESITKSSFKEMVTIKEEVEVLEDVTKVEKHTGKKQRDEIGEVTEQTETAKGTRVTEIKEPVIIETVETQKAIEKVPEEKTTRKVKRVKVPKPSEEKPTIEEIEETPLEETTTEIKTEKRVKKTKKVTIEDLEFQEATVEEVKPIIEEPVEEEKPIVEEVPTEPKKVKKPKQKKPVVEEVPEEEGVQITEIETEDKEWKEAEVEDIVPEQKPKEKKPKKIKPKQEKPKVDEEEEKPAEEVTEEPKKPRVAKQKSVLMTIEHVEAEQSTKAKVMPVKDVPGQFPKIELRKAKVVQKPKEKPKTPKMRLKSRIVLNEFPPLGEKEQIPIIKTLEPVYRDQGVLSRNIKEAEKAPKSKKIRVKDFEKEFKELEKLDLEMEEMKSKKLEEVDEQFKYERAPKKKPEEKEEPKPLKIGKGKVPKEEIEPEQVVLKKLPEKIEEDRREPEEVPKKPEKKEKPKKTEKPEEEDDKIKFKPFDIDREEPEKIEKETFEQEKPEKEKPEKKKEKIPKTKKPKPEPEVEEITIVKGVPKPKPEEEETDVTFKAKQKPKPEEEPEGIKLKPFKKPETPEELQKVTTDEIGKLDAVPSHDFEKDDIEFKPPDDKAPTKKKKIIKKVKPKPGKELEEAKPEEVTPEEQQQEEVKEEEEEVRSVVEEEEIKPIIEEKKPEPLEPTEIKEKEEAQPISEVPEEKKDKVTKIIKIKKKKEKEGKKDDEQIEEIKPVEEQKPEIKEKPQRLLIIKRTPDKPQQPQITEPEKPEFATIKLKKTKVEKKEIETKKIEKMLLKSRIVHVTFPPLSEIEQKPIITTLEPVVRDNGILSRNIAEARKIKKSKKKEVVDLKKLEELDAEVEELRQQELEKVSEDFRKRPEARKKETPQPIVIEKAPIPPVQHIKIKEPEEQPINLAELKLKKTKVPQKEEVKEKKPKFLLKSRIVHVTFPPIEELEQKPKITLLEPVYRDNGVLSRSVEEAKKIKKKKPVKISDVDVELKKLEKLDLEVEELQKQEKEKVDEQFKYERKPKQKEEKPEEAEVKIKLGKGKIPEKSEDEESVTLKKVPQKVKEEDVTVELKKPKVTEKEKPKPEITEKEEPKLEPFKPYDIDREEPEKLEYKPVKEEEPVKDIPEEEKPKRPKKKKEKTEPEEDEFKLIKGKPKPEETEEVPDIKLKYKQKPPPEVAPEEIKLKPISKEKPEEPAEVVAIVKSEEQVPKEKPVEVEKELTIPEKTAEKKKKVKKVTKPKEKQSPEEVEISQEEKPKVEEEEKPKLEEEEKPKVEEKEKPKVKEEVDVPKVVEEEIPEVPKAVEEIVSVEKPEDEVEEETTTTTVTRRRKVVKKKQKPDEPSEEEPVIEEPIIEEPKPIEEEKKPEEEKPKSVEPAKEEPVEVKPKPKPTEEAKPEEVKPVKKPRKIIEKPKPKAAKLPRLKSRIVYVDFPPADEIERKPVITQLEPVVKDHGEISRNIKDAEKRIKTKARKLKDEDKVLQDLEKLDLEMEELKSKQLEKVDEAFKLEKKPKKPKEEVTEETVPLKIGKGKVPDKVEEEEETIKLKKAPERVKEEILPEEKTPKVTELEEEKKVKKEPKDVKDKIEFKPTDYEREEPEKIEFEKPEFEKPEKEIPEEEKTKYEREKKEKSVPEEKEIKIKKGKPKKKEPEEEEDVKFKIKQKDKPEEEPEEIKLKPFKKPEKEEPEEKVTIEKVEPTVPKEEVVEKAVIKIKKKKEPEKSEEEEKVEITIKKPEPEEKIEEVVEEQVIIKKKPPKEPEPVEEPAVEITLQKKPEPVEEEIAVAEVVIQKKPPKPEEPPEEPTAEITITKKSEPEVTEDVTTTEEITVKAKKKKKVPKPQEEEAAEITIKRKPEIEEEQVEAEVTIKEKPEPEEKPEKPEDVEAKVTIKKKKTKEPEEPAAEITIKKEVPVEPEKPEEPEAEITIKKKKPKEPEKPEEPEAEVTIKKKPEPEVTEAEAEQQVKIPKKKKKPVKVEEEPEASITIKKEEPTVEEDIKIKKKVPPKKEEDEAEAELTVKKLEIQEEPEDVVSEFTVKKKAPRREPSIEEHEEQSITIKKLKPVRKASQPQITEYTEVENVTFRPKTSKTIEDVQQEFKISLDSYEQEEISMSGKVKLKKERPLTYNEESVDESIKITKEIEQEGPPDEEIIDEGSDAEELPYDDESESYNVPFKRRPSRKYSVVEEGEQEVQIGFKEKPQDIEEESITVKPKRKPSQPSFEQEAVSLSITKETEVIDERPEIVEVVEGDVYFSVHSYQAEADQAIDLVEGERVYVLETPNSDWWLVKKHLTEEKGWVPAQILMDEPNYTMYVQRKLNEKIDKLPVFEKPKPEEKAVAPRFIEKLQPVITPDGYTVQFECKVKGFPRPQITWFRQTAVIKPSQDFQMYYDEDNVATLIISEVFPEDAGTFTCVAKNSAGFASSTTELIVELPLSDHGSDITGLSRKSMSRESSLADILEGIPPTFSRKPKPQYVPEKSDVVVDCRLVAVPEPEIIWYRNGKRITSKNNVTIITTSDMHSYTTILKIKEVEKKQEGTYEIIAKNREGEATVQFTLKVKTGDKESPQVLEPLKSITVRKTETVILSTTIAGHPAPTISWFKNGKPIKKPTPKKDGDTYSLTIVNTTTEDTAEYTVKATNSVGTAETTAQLTVEEFPDNAEPPLFVERFEEKIVQENETIRLFARVVGNPVPEVYWLRDNQPLKPSDKVKISYDGENIELIIEKADSETDTGDYKCIASNPAGKASHGAKVTVDVDVKFTKKLKKTYETSERHTIKMECETSHKTSTKWFHNDVEISGMDHREVIQDGRKHKLIIKKTTKKDEGHYKCTIKNEKTETVLKVLPTKPEFIRKLQDIEVTEKEEAALEVEISSETAEVIWSKDGNAIDDTDARFELKRDKGVRRLLIRSTSIHDEGEYICTLVDEECKAEVTVIELPPEIVTPLQDKTVIKGEKTVFEIELSKGDALVRWFKNGTEIQFSEHIQLSIDGKRQKLKIYKTEEEDAGTYSCEVGTQQSSAQLTVQVPTVTFIRPLPEYTIVPKKSNAEFEVELSREDAEVTWLRQGKKIKKSSKYTVTSEKTIRKLVVHEVTEEDLFEYTCTVETLKTSSKLKIGDKPSPPRAPLEISGMSSTSFTMKWSPSESDGGSPIIEYIVEMKDVKSKKDFKKLGSTKGDITDIPVNNLEKDHGYKFRITARNAIGLSEPYLPEETIVAGSRITPPSPPINLAVTDIQSRSATLTWQPPLNNGGTEITGYVVEKKLEFMPSWEKVYTLEANCLQYTFENLKEKSEYLFRVFAENSVGLSVPAATEMIQLRSHATVPSPPTPPLEIRTIGPNAIVIEWGVPEWDGGSPLLGYNIAIRDTKKTMWMEIGRVGKGVQKFTIRDLQEDHEYMIRIFAKNEIGLSDPLESDEPFKVLPSGDADQDDFREATDREPTSYSTTTTSWLKENSMDADISSYSKGQLLRKDEYFFRIWCHAKKLFK